MRKLLILIILQSSFITVAQDTTRLSLENVLKITLAYHPVVKQASLFNEAAEANILQAKGQFDPKLQMDYNLKDFKEKEYYNLLNTSLKIPTWIGIEPKLAFRKNSGEYLNPENYISNSTNYEQIALGLSVPLGKGLFFDERRNIVRQAEAFSQIAKAEQIKQTNKILLTVIKDYWNWYLAYQRMGLLDQAMTLADNLFDRTLLDYEFGEASVVDTLQAKINLQKRAVDYRKAQLDFELSKLNIAKHIWSEDLLPLELQESAIPDSESLFSILGDKDIKEGIEFAMENHPEINMLEGKRNQLDFELKWNKESIKPEMDLSYSFLDTPFNPSFQTSAFNFGQNYKLGLDFSFPIFLRKERGKIQQTRLKIQSNEYAVAQNQIEVKNEVLGQYAQSIALQDLSNQYQRVSDNYERLLEAEINNLQNGETDLFKLTIQQDKFIEAKSDFFDAFVKWEKSKAEYHHATGKEFLGLSNMFGIDTNQ
jgi:outer membrane protein TolC